MSDSTFYVVTAIAGIGLFAIIIGYFMLSKRYSKDDLKYIKELKKDTENHTFSLDVIYQKLYVFYAKVPAL